MFCRDDLSDRRGRARETASSVAMSAEGSGAATGGR